MVFCINPRCAKPENSDSLKFCVTCGSPLWLEDQLGASEKIAEGMNGVEYRGSDRSSGQTLRIVYLEDLQKRSSPTGRWRSTLLEGLVRLQREEAPHSPRVATAMAFLPRIRSTTTWQDRIYVMFEDVDCTPLSAIAAESGFSEGRAYEVLRRYLEFLDVIHSAGLALGTLNTQTLAVDEEGQYRFRMFDVNATPPLGVNPRTDLAQLGTLIAALLNTKEAGDLLRAIQAGKDPLDDVITNSVLRSVVRRSRSLDSDPEISAATLLDELLRGTTRESRERAYEVVTRVGKVKTPLRHHLFAACGAVGGVVGLLLLLGFLAVITDPGEEQLPTPQSSEEPAGR